MTFLLRLFSFLLPDKIKRMIFLASLNAKLNNISKPDEEILDRLNKVLSLASDARAIELPMQISYSIWTDFSVDDLTIIGLKGKDLTSIAYRTLNNYQKLNLANLIIKRSPKWLRYNDALSIQTDVLKMFNEC